MVREMGFEDVDEVYDIECESFSIPWTKNALNIEVAYEGAFYLVAEMEKQVVAYAGLRKVIDEGHITNLAVKKMYRGQGIGKIIVNELLNRGFKIGLRKFTLEVRISNETAISLYKSLGFTIAGQRKNYYEKPKEHGLIMWKEM
jgi:ribosomal-protein-alanine N-acetyltransferase